MWRRHKMASVREKSFRERVLPILSQNFDRASSRIWRKSAHSIHLVSSQGKKRFETSLVQKTRVTRLRGRAPLFSAVLIWEEMIGELERENEEKRDALTGRWFSINNATCVACSINNLEVVQRMIFQSGIIRWICDNCIYS